MSTLVYPNITTSCVCLLSSPQVTAPHKCILQVMRRASSISCTQRAELDHGLQFLGSGSSLSFSTMSLWDRRVCQSPSATAVQLYFDPSKGKSKTFHSASSSEQAQFSSVCTVGKCWALSTNVQLVQRSCQSKVKSLAIHKKETETIGLETLDFNTIIRGNS